MAAAGLGLVPNPRLWYHVRIRRGCFFYSQMCILFINERIYTTDYMGLMGNIGHVG